MLDMILWIALGLLVVSVLIKWLASLSGVRFSVKVGKGLLKLLKGLPVWLWQIIGILVLIWFVACLFLSPDKPTQAEEAEVRREKLAKAIKTNLWLTNQRQQILDGARSHGWVEKQEHFDLRTAITDGSAKPKYTGLNLALCDASLRWHFEGITDPSWNTWNMDYRMVVGSNPWHEDNSYTVLSDRGVSGKLPADGMTKVFSIADKKSQSWPNRQFHWKLWKELRASPSHFTITLTQVLREAFITPCTVLPKDSYWQVYVCFGYPRSTGDDMWGVNLPVHMLSRPIDSQGTRPGLWLKGVTSGKEVWITSAEANQFGEIVISSLDGRLLPGGDTFLPNEDFTVYVFSPDIPGPLTEVDTEVVIRVDLPEVVTKRLQ